MHQSLSGNASLLETKVKDVSSRIGAEVTELQVEIDSLKAEVTDLLSKNKQLEQENTQLRTEYKMLDEEKSRGVKKSVSFSTAT